MSNPIIAIAKETWDSHDTHSHACEWLFQLARIADERLIPHNIDYRDPGGPATRQESHDTGEDYVYWEAIDADPTDKEITEAIAVFDRIYEMTKGD